MAGMPSHWSTLKMLIWYYATKHKKKFSNREKPEKMKPETPEK